MNKSNEFFQELAQVIQSGATATLQVKTACGHVASISINEGEVQAIRYSRHVGQNALIYFQTLEVESFSRKDSSSSLFYKNAENPISTKMVIAALEERLVLPAQKPATALSNSQVESQPSEATTAGVEQPKNYAIQYRGSTSNPFMRRGKK